jgi:hypothetical protein
MNSFSFLLISILSLITVPFFTMFHVHFSLYFNILFELLSFSKSWKEKCSCLCVHGGKVLLGLFLVFVVCPGQTLFKQIHGTKVSSLQESADIPYAQPAAEHGDSVRVDSQIIISSPCLLAFGEKRLEGRGLGVLGVAGATRW